MEIKEYIKDMARERCIDLLETYKKYVSDVSARPSDVKHFANYVRGLNAYREGEKKLFQSTSQVTDILMTDRPTLTD